MAPALAQLPQLTGLELGRPEARDSKAGDHLGATRVAGGWRVRAQHYLQPGVAAALARSFSGAAAPAGQQEQLPQQPAAKAAAGQRSKFSVGVAVDAGGPSPERASELASLGRALAAFDAVHLALDCGRACPADAHALLATVAARLTGVELWGVSDSADAVLGALQRLVLPRLASLLFHHTPRQCTLSAVMAVAGLDAPLLATISLNARFAGSRATVVAAVAALAVGRLQPVGPDGRPAGLTVAVGEAALSDEELGSVCEVVAAMRGPGCVTVGRPEA
jgi:hypothetical protein